MATPLGDWLPALEAAYRREVDDRLVSTEAKLDALALAVPRLRHLANGRFTHRLDESTLDATQHVVATTAMVPDLTPYSDWGSLLVEVAVLVLLEGGERVRAEENLGSYSGPGHSASMTSQSAEMRRTAERQAARVRDLLRRRVGLAGHQHGVSDTRAT